MILQRMNKRQALKHWREFSYPVRREKVIDEFNRSTLDDVGPVGGDQEIKVLKELDEMQEKENKKGLTVRSCEPRSPHLKV